MKSDSHDTRPPTSKTHALLDEGVLTVTAAAAAEGIEISSKTALRWCLGGVRGTRLESLKISGRRLTSRAALRRFFELTQQQAIESGPPTIDRDAANQVLTAYGLGRKEAE